MHSLYTVALAALLLSSSTLAREYGDPTPTTTSWITPTVTLPSPYDSPSIYLIADSAGACQASFEAYSSNSCKLQTSVYPSTTTLAFGLDCMGCSELAVNVRLGHCPMGGHHTSYPDTTLTTPRTRWMFVCAPTPAPAGPVSYA